MAKSPPGVNRLVAVLNFFAEHPNQAFSFTEIVKALRLGGATCHALLTGLVETGYLYRNPDKTYVIGPLLVRLARSVTEEFSPLQAIHPELRKLADDFGLTVSAVTREANELIIQAKAGYGASFVYANLPVGGRLPLQASLIAPHFAWSSQSEVDDWMATYGNSPTKKKMAAIYESIKFVRTHGFSCLVSNPKVPKSDDHRTLIWPQASSEAPMISIYELEAQKDYEAVAILAPVFDSQGRTSIVLSLTGFQYSITGARILEIGSALVAASSRITFFIDGKSPAG